jgi:hypothetical protein
MRFDDRLLEDIKARIPPSRLIGRSVALQRAGASLKALSPFTKEKTPSFYVNDEKKIFKCFSSGHGGDIFKWLMLTEGLSFPEAVERLAAEAGVALPDWDQFPQIWKGSTGFRLFISHISTHKLKATRLRECLTPFNISGFVAHEDIPPTCHWTDEIERALRVMDAFVAIHTKEFNERVWTQQEIGFATCRRVKIISLKMEDGADPEGFIARFQALPRRGRTAEEIAPEINTLLLDDERTRGRLRAAQRLPSDYLKVG